MQALKRAIKYISVTLLTIILLVLMVPAVVYIPYVQKIVVNQVLSVLNANTDHLHYGVRSLQLKFPLELELWDLCLRREGDTLAYVHHLKTALDDFPHGEQPNFVMHQLMIEGVQTGIDSAFIAGLDLNGTLDTLRIRDVFLNLDSNVVGVRDILLAAPHFAAGYASTDSIEEEPDTTSTANWNIALGQLDITDAKLHYDGWNVDSLFLHLSRFEMIGNRIQLDTLAIDLPESHLGVSASMDMAYLQISTQGWIKANLDLLLSRQDLLYVAGEALPNLATYWPDSTDVKARLSAYVTPDTLQLQDLSLMVPRMVCLEANAHGVHPFANDCREADLYLDLDMMHIDTLVSAFVDVPSRRSYRLPDGLSLRLDASQRQNQYNAVLCFLQDSVQRLNVEAGFNQQNETYNVLADLRHFFLEDYLPGVKVEDVNLQLEASGQHFDMSNRATVLDACLKLDTLCYDASNDSTQLKVSLQDVGLKVSLLQDSLRLHGDINVNLAEMGRFDTLRIDFLNAPNQMDLDVNAGDAKVCVAATCDLDHLMNVMDRVLNELDIQTQSKIFDINALQASLPSLTMDIDMRRDNPIAPLLSQQGVTMDHLSFLLTNSDSLRLDAAIDTLSYEGIEVARIGAHLRPQGGNYDYLADVLYLDSITGKDFNLGLKARLLSDSITAEGNLWADTMQVLTFDGCLTNRIHADIYMSALPLTVANGFLSEDLRLAGTLNGHAVLDCDSIDFNALEAALWFDQASVWYGGCDMNLGLPHDSIVYRDGQLLLDHIRFKTANEQPIVIDGNVDMRKCMDNPEINLSITSDKAHIIDNKRRRNRQQFLCGRLPLSSKVGVTGTLNDLKVDGQITIPKGCDLTYYYEEGEVASNSQLNGLVEFVEFGQQTMYDGLLMGDSLIQVIDTTLLAVEQKPVSQSSKLDVQLRLKIDPSTSVLVYLPTSSDDKVQIQGGGNLKMGMDAKGDLHLSGGYEVTGGDINFKLPMLPVTKEFALTSDSWLRWTGVVDQPELNLLAQEGVKCTINDTNSGARVVKFIVSILIKGTLENMDIIFDCTAPNDAAIQGELASLTAEDRSKQALMLLIAQTYTGPSASTSSSAGISSANAAISSLVNKELESLLTNKMKHTEINVGIDTYDSNGTGAQQTDYSVSVSQKFFNDRMRVTVGGKMSTGEEVQQDESSIINDVSVEWLIKPDASQYARLFRHTNYQSVLEGEVVETGVGYVQKREAFRFKHLFVRLKKRKVAREQMLKQLETGKNKKTRQ